MQWVDIACLIAVPVLFKRSFAFTIIANRIPKLAPFFGCAACFGFWTAMLGLTHAGSTLSEAIFFSVGTATASYSVDRLLALIDAAHDFLQLKTSESLGGSNGESD